MNDHDADRSLFAELAARRKRSADLHERAIERGIATAPAASDDAGDTESGPAPEAPPAVEREDVVAPATEPLERAIAESEPLLGPEPETPELEESVVEAEKLADQIGQVVDIHRLPKTKPTRVLTKAAKLEADERGESERKPSQSSSVESCAPSGPASPPKKKKRVTLLDSYFKGL